MIDFGNMRSHLVNTNARTIDPDAPRCMSNLRKEFKGEALAAIAKTELAIEWRDAPDERMSPEQRDIFGSVWARPGLDCSAFWHEFAKATEA